MNLIDLHPQSPTHFKSAEIKKIFLNEGESLNVESSAMLACRNVEIETGFNGSLFSVFKRYFFGGESLFQNSFKAKNGGGWIALEEAVPGQINAYELKTGKTLTVGRGAYVASDSNVKISTDFAGILGWRNGLGLVKLKASINNGDRGRVFFNSREGIAKVIKINQEDGPIIVDNNNLVAYTDDLEVSIRKMGGLKSLLFSGEGIVNEFKGNGLVFVGSGKNAARENISEKILNLVFRTILPNPVTLLNRVMILGMVYIVARSPHLYNLGEAIREVGRSISQAHSCKI